MAGRQLGFWDVDERLRELSAQGDPLEKLAGTVDFEIFRAELDAALGLRDRSHLAALALTHPDEPPIRESQAQGAFNLILAYSTGWGFEAVAQIDAARALYDDLAALALTHPDEPSICESQAQGAFNLLMAYGSVGQIDAARALYDDLAALALTHPDEPPIREIQARAARLLEGAI